jgi:hypothetical protein
VGKLASARAVRGQLASMDIVISIIVVMLLVSAVLLLITKISKQKEPKAIHGGLVMMNLENIDNPTYAFLSDYSVDEAKLSLFGGQSPSVIKNIIYEGTEFSDDFETCIFFLNNSAPVMFNGIYEIKTGACTYNRPCPSTGQARMYVKPVMFKGDVVNMYVAVCG